VHAQSGAPLKIDGGSAIPLAVPPPSPDRSLQDADREEVKRRFQRGEIDPLVGTDAAAEGLNLQTADLLINFDLPWNPMRWSSGSAASSLSQEQSIPALGDFRKR